MHFSACVLGLMDKGDWPYYYAMSINPNPTPNSVSTQAVSTSTNTHTTLTNCCRGTRYCGNSTSLSSVLVLTEPHTRVIKAKCILTDLAVLQTMMMKHKKGRIASVRQMQYSGDVIALYFFVILLFTTPLL